MANRQPERPRSKKQLGMAIGLPLLLVAGAILAMRLQTPRENDARPIFFEPLRNLRLDDVQVAFFIEGFSSPADPRYADRNTFGIAGRPDPEHAVNAVSRALLDLTLYGPMAPGVVPLPEEQLVEPGVLRGDILRVLNQGGVRVGDAPVPAGGPGVSLLQVVVQGTGKGDTVFFTGSMQLAQPVYASKNERARAGRAVTWSKQFHGTATKRTIKERVHEAIDAGARQFIDNYKLANRRPRPDG